MGELRREHDRILERVVLKTLNSHENYSVGGHTYRVAVRAYEARGETIEAELLNTVYTIRLDENRIYEVHAKPDAYALLALENPPPPLTNHHPPPGAFNLVIEVTQRPESHITLPWIQALTIPFYLRNLQPTGLVLVTPTGVKARLLRPHDTLELARSLARPPRRRPTLSLCRNCDLRSQCPSPLT